MYGIINQRNPLIQYDILHNMVTNSRTVHKISYVVEMCMPVWV